MGRYLDATFALLLEQDDNGALEERLDEPLPHEVDQAAARRLELRRQARENQEALGILGGLARR